MMKMILSLLILSVSALAQAPTLNGKLLTGQTNLSESLTWTAIPNATYSVYEANALLNVCPASNSADWVEVADGLSATTYTDTPSDQTVPWCTAVTATVNNVESAQSNQLIFFPRNQGYLTLGYRDSDCKTDITFPSGAVVTYRQTLNDAVTNIPLIQNPVNQFSWRARVFDGAIYTFYITFPDGDQFTYVLPLARSFIPASAVWQTTIDFLKVENTNPINPGKVCHLDENDYYQVTATE